MRKLFPLLFLLFAMQTSHAITHPRHNIFTISQPSASAITDHEPPRKSFHSIRIRDVQKLLGRKLTLKEKIAYKIFQWKLKKRYKSIQAEKSSDKGTFAMVLGIAGLVFIFVPYVALLSIPLAILAIIFAANARKENPKDKHARIGSILGWITIGIFVLALIIVLAWFANGLRWF